MLVLTITQMVAQDTSIKGKITLSHQGKERVFDYNKMADAVTAAVEGDTIFLSTGYFEGDFIIDKKLAFIGSGADTDNNANNYTTYSGKIILKMAENTKLTARLFESIYFGNNASFSFQTAIEDVVFKKCNGINYNFTVDTEIKSMLFDRCYIDGNFYLNQNIKKIICRNCCICSFNYDHTYQSSEDIPVRQFTNCTIDPANYGYIDEISEGGNYHLYCPIFAGEFVNCIFDNDDSDDNSGFCLYNRYNKGDVSTASFTNCLFYKPKDELDIFNGATVKDNMYYEAPSDNNTQWTRIYEMTKDQLLSNNFLGNDGTVVGCLGGKNPYSLKISEPIISYSKVHFDTNKKQVQIKMKVSSQQ